MHPSAQTAAISFFEEYVGTEEVRVVELGASSEGVLLRDCIPTRLPWVGVDLAPGHGVDVVLSDPYELPFQADSFDVAVATSVFEHNEMFWLSFLELVRVTSPGGLIYLCSPSNGHIHRYPVDCYRFYPDAGVSLQNWGRRSGYEVTLIESLVLRKDQSEWNDWIAVFRTSEDTDGNQEASRLTHRLQPFSIGQGTDIFEFLKTEATEDQIDLQVALRALSGMEP